VGISSRITVQKYNDDFTYAFTFAPPATCISAPSMDEGTLETPNPKCRHYWSFLFEVVSQLNTSEDDI
jgi:hypothetical protein